jgi:hypothetical protein
MRGETLESITEYLSLGYFHEPGQWSMSFFNDEAAQFFSTPNVASPPVLAARVA